jgi:DNA-binding IclR family transcriptional regulator
VVSEEEVDEGAVGVAAPIRDAVGTVRAVVSVAGPAHRFDESRRDAIVAAVRDAAASVSEALGYRAASAEAVVDRMRAAVG